MKVSSKSNTLYLFSVFFHFIFLPTTTSNVARLPLVYFSVYFVERSWNRKREFARSAFKNAFRIMKYHISLDFKLYLSKVNNNNIRSMLSALYRCILCWLLTGALSVDYFWPTNILKVINKDSCLMCVIDFSCTHQKHTCGATLVNLNQIIIYFTHL